MNKLKIGNKEIDDKNPCFIIAEVGLNHNGNVKTAKKLICEAAKANSNAVKFQIFKTEELCSENSNYFNLFKSLEFQKETWIDLYETAKNAGIIFLASVFDEESSDLYENLGAPAFKIASGDLNHIPLLKYISKKNKPIILSSGNSTIGEIKETIKVLKSEGNKQLALLHCVSAYPTKYDEVNLRAISTLKNIFDIPVGFSDHTLGSLISISAVAAGSNIIEKHFTLNKNFNGADHKFSLEPHEFLQMVSSIRSVESALGDGIKNPTENEIKIKENIRRSIVAIKDISKGKIITGDMVRILRPGTGIEPKFLDNVIGKVAKKNIKKYSSIKWDQI